MSMAWLSHLVSSTDAKVDSLIVGGIVVAMPTLCFLEIWEVVFKAHDFTPMSFSGAVGTILAAVGGGKRVRDQGWGRNTRQKGQH